ncbi:hypothetical protein B0H11DRAFT_1108343 [Mycena galericulata]|nr:hypothetical protein B0H11DRAFT_1108343 [Mycena galericulata]
MKTQFAPCEPTPYRVFLAHEIPQKKAAIQRKEKSLPRIQARAPTPGVSSPSLNIRCLQLEAEDRSPLLLLQSANARTRRSTLANDLDTDELLPIGVPSDVLVDSEANPSAGVSAAGLVASEKKKQIKTAEIACQTDDVAPEVREVEKLVEVRVETVVERVVERVVEVPVERIVEKTVELPVDRILAELERRAERWIHKTNLPLDKMEPLLRSALAELQDVLRGEFSTVPSEAPLSPPTIYPTLSTAAPAAEAPPLLPATPTLHIRTPHPISTATRQTSIPVSATPPSPEPAVNALVAPVKVDMSGSPCMSLSPPPKYHAMRSEVTQTIKWGLKKATGDQDAFMCYNGFEHRVKAKVGWNLVGWPSHRKMQPPSAMGAGGTRLVTDLWDGLKDGSVYWEKISAADFEALRSQYLSAGRSTSGKRKRTKDLGEAVVLNPRPPKRNKPTIASDALTSSKENEFGESTTTPSTPSADLAAAAAG